MTFSHTWTVLNLSTETDATIRSWLNAAQLPSCLQFVFASPFGNLWYIGNWYGGTMPAPVAPWTICFSSNTDPRFNWGNIYGLGWGSPNNNCSIRFDTNNVNDTPAERGARAWHEMSHAMGMPADNMKTSEFTGFSQYLINTNSPHQDFITNPSSYDAQTPKHTALLIEFYTYLMKKYYPCDCYGENCETDPCVSDQCGETCANRTCEKCPNMPGCEVNPKPWTKEMILLAGAGAIVLYYLV